ncbi:MAG: DUF4382 domain-containing protein [Desulfobacteraceae bacterium]|nr:DUF4382 domain-containing protein [Desulfobacteraceae bacterium]MBC2757392.1 DUF4382 domain-containing protein [Desulfobacteraceae bacterium]
MKIFKFFIWVVFSGCLFILLGCDGSSSSSGTGSLSLYLTDVSSDEYQAVYVTIDEVWVHRGDDPEGEDPEGEDPEGEDPEGEETDGWQVVASPATTYNLLDLVNGVMEKLGTTDLETGLYTQMRLMLKDTPDDGDNLLGQMHPYPNYIIDKEDGVHELKVPSGYQTGIKLVHSFEIISGQTADLILDFDATKSVVQAGKSGKYILKPTIKVIGTVDNGIVSGTVTDADNEVLSGVFVSAQISDPNAANLADQVIIATSTLTDENGNYSMYLEPGTYLIVAYKGTGTDYGTAFGPECAGLTVDLNSTNTRDFQLLSVLTGHIITDIQTSEEIVNVSFRRTADCGSGGETIEVTSLSVSEDDEYTARLPGGDIDPITYTVIAYTSEETYSAFADVSAGEDIEVDFDFSTSP